MVFYKWSFCLSSLSVWQHRAFWTHSDTIQSVRDSWEWSHNWIWAYSVMQLQKKKKKANAVINCKKDVIMLCKSYKCYFPLIHPLEFILIAYFLFSYIYDLLINIELNDAGRGIIFKFLFHNFKVAFIIIVIIQPISICRHHKSEACSLTLDRWHCLIKRTRMSQLCQFILAKQKPWKIPQITWSNAMKVFTGDNKHLKLYPEAHWQPVQFMKLYQPQLELATKKWRIAP